MLLALETWLLQLKRSQTEQGWAVGRSQREPIAQGLPQRGCAELGFCQMC